METVEESTAVDLSWLWHCSSNPDNIIDYSSFVYDPKLSAALTRSAVVGFRLALKSITDLGVITMCDIDRSPTDTDQEKFNSAFKNNS